MKDIPSHSTLAKFFVPLALQAISQALTHPLVAIVASHGPGGTLNLAGVAQAQNIMWFIGTLTAGIIVTGMVHAKDREGFAQFVKVNRSLILIMFGIQGIFCIPALSHFLFGMVIGLPAGIEQPATKSFIACIPLLILFNLRAPYLVILFNHRETAKAFGATVGRIVLTICLSPLFCWVGAVGPVWAVVCLSIPVVVEALVLRHLAAPYIANLPSGKASPGKWEIFNFSIPYAIGGFFMAFSGSLVGAFISRAAEPARMMSAYYVAAQIASPVAFGASRMQAVAISFCGSVKRDKKILRFALLSSSLLGIVPLLLLLPGVSTWYYVVIQNLPPADLPLVRATALMLALNPISVGLRAFGEGKASYLKKPFTVLTGQAVYMGMIASVCFLALGVGVPGNLIGPSGIVVANFVAAGAVFFAISWKRKKEPEGMPAAYAEAGEVVG